MQDPRNVRPYRGNIACYISPYHAPNGLHPQGVRDVCAGRNGFVEVVGQKGVFAPELVDELRDRPLNPGPCRLLLATPLSGPPPQIGTLVNLFEKPLLLFFQTRSLGQIVRIPRTFQFDADLPEPFVVPAQRLRVKEFGPLAHGGDRGIAAPIAQLQRRDRARRRLEQEGDVPRPQGVRDVRGPPGEGDLPDGP